MIRRLSVMFRYETEGLQFFATRQDHRKGPNNIVDMWKEFTIRAC